MMDPEFCLLLIQTCTTSTYVVWLQAASSQPHTTVHVRTERRTTSEPRQWCGFEATDTHHSALALRSYEFKADDSAPYAVTAYDESRRCARTHVNASGYPTRLGHVIAVRSGANDDKPRCSGTSSDPRLSSLQNPPPDQFNGIHHRWGRSHPDWLLCRPWLRSSTTPAPSAMTPRRTGPG